MDDHVWQLNTILSSTGESLLNGPGSVSHQQAMDKAREEYRKFQARELSPVERTCLDTIKALLLMVMIHPSMKSRSLGICLSIFQYTFCSILILLYV